MTALPAPDRRLAERRVSPAVGQFAIQECARLKQVNAELLAALQKYVDHFGDPLKCARAAILKAQP